jgi:hypothetical protein
MGEYGKRITDGTEVKIGTCKSMYYLRYEDRHLIEQVENSLDPKTETGLFWRLPFPDEDAVHIGEYKEHNRGESLYKDNCTNFSDPDTVGDPGIMQLRNDAGLLLNVNCYHGEKLPEGSADIKPFWNGKSWFYELAFIKNAEDGVKPVVRCRFCGGMWRYKWYEILPYLHGDLKTRLEKYSVELEKVEA